MKRALLLVVAVAAMLALHPALAGAAGKYRIGITTYGLANDYIRDGRNAAIERSKELGVDLVMSVDDSVSKRVSAIENFIAQGVNAIIVHEGDATQVLPSLQAAKKAGILVCAMNSGYNELFDLSVEPANTQQGTVAAEEMARLMGFKGNVVEIYNDAGAMIKARKDAMHEVLKKYPGMKITSGFVYAWPDYFPDSVSKMEAIFQANPEPGKISGVFATFYGVGLAAAKVIREKGLQKYCVVVGIDSDADTFREMRLPDSPYKATVMSDPVQLGRDSITKIVALLNGEKLADRHLYLESKLITKANLPKE